MDAQALTKDEKMHCQAYHSANTASQFTARTSSSVKSRLGKIAGSESRRGSLSSHIAAPGSQDSANRTSGKRALAEGVGATVGITTKQQDYGKEISGRDRSIEAFSCKQLFSLIDKWTVMAVDVSVTFFFISK